MNELRSSPSGPIARPVNGFSVQSFGWSMSAPLSLILVPAGHEEGLWMITADFINRVDPVAAQLRREITYSCPGISGNTTMSSPFFAVTQFGHGGTTNWSDLCIMSTGLSDIHLLLRTTGLGGPTPSADVYVSAYRVGGLL